MLEAIALTTEPQPLPFVQLMFHLKYFCTYIHVLDSTLGHSPQMGTKFSFNFNYTQRLEYRYLQVFAKLKSSNIKV